MHSYIGNALFRKAAGCAKPHVGHGVGAQSLAEHGFNTPALTSGGPAVSCLMRLSIANGGVVCHIQLSCISSRDAVACRLTTGHQQCLGLEAIVTAQVLENKLRALEHYLKEYQERRRLAVRSSPSSRHRMLHSGGYPDDPSGGTPRQSARSWRRLQSWRTRGAASLRSSLGRSQHSFTLDGGVYDAFIDSAKDAADQALQRGSPAECLPWRMYGKGSADV